MAKLAKLIMIGIIAGLILAACMKIIFLISGNEAYQLLYNVDYIPLIHVYDDLAYFGICFHYVFCIVSVVGLYYVLQLFNLQKKSALYIIIYTTGSGILYFLTLLTNQPPDADSFLSWFYWTTSHILYGIAVAWPIKKWL